MMCLVCGSSDGPCARRKLKKPSFFINLRSNYKDHLNVPCFARKKFHAITENATTLHVETEDKEYYTFQVRNGSYKTRIYGGDYPKFLINYDMKAGDTININMENPDHFGFVKLYPYDKYGFKKERVEEEFDFLEDAERVVVSKGVDLTYTQISKINHHIVENGVGLGVVFIHRLTPSDINKNQMHIPKFAANKLNIPRSGVATLEMDQDDGDDFVCQAEYFTSTDGRIRFRNGWTEFASNNELEAGMDTVILFFKIDNKVHFNFCAMF